MVRSGISWKTNETVIELWQNSYETDSDNKSSTTVSLCAEEDEEEYDNDIEYSNTDNLEFNEDIFDCESICDKNQKHVEVIKKTVGEGSDEDDSLLVAYDANSVISFWQKKLLLLLICTVMLLKHQQRVIIVMLSFCI